MNRQPWTPEEDMILRELYPQESVFAKQIAAATGHTISSVYRRASILGIRKPESFRSVAGKIGTQHERAKANRFTKGMIPRNKGKKMSSDVYERCKGTMFKKGQKPVNFKPVGSERVNVDGYVEIKVANPRTWKLKHRVIWEEANGPIPPGYNVQFKNRNALDVRLENLYLISKADQMKNENSLVARYPKDLQEVIRLRGSIKRQITMYNRKRNEKES